MIITAVLCWCIYISPCLILSCRYQIGQSRSAKVHVALFPGIVLFSHRESQGLGLIASNRLCRTPDGFAFTKYFTPAP